MDRIEEMIQNLELLRMHFGDITKTCMANGIIDSTVKAIEKLATYEDLGYTPEELKLCFNPPERIYQIGNEVDGSRIYTLYPVDAEEIEIIGGDVYWNCRDNFGDVAEIPLGGLHEDYFLSHEEAGAKLKEMENQNV